MSHSQAVIKGIAPRFVDAMDYIIESTWEDAAKRKQPVGGCRHGACGGLLMPRHMYEVGKVQWFDADCDNCGSTVSSPGGRVLRRSTRRDEMPPGWWDKRMENIKKVNDALKGNLA